MIQVPTDKQRRRAADPQRRCAGCRRRAPRGSLLRFVADQAGRLRLDPQQRAPGRGVYLCPSRECFEVACRRAALARGLRRKLVPVEASELRRGTVERLRLAASLASQQGLEDGRLERGDERLSRRLQAWAEQAQRLDAWAGRDLDRAGGSGKTEARQS